MTSQRRRDIYQEVTDRILTLLEQGTVPWRYPIRRGSGGGRPMNLASGKAYRGINFFLLAMRAWEAGYESDYWLTFRQAAERGGQVRKGEKSSLVVFWKQLAKTDRDSGEEVTIPILRHYNVFNVEQCDGIDPPDAPNETATEAFAPLARAEQVVAGYRDGPEIVHRGLRAVYSAVLDRVEIADPERFENRESYYATLFHELSHSTGHAKRLNRGLGLSLAPFGSPDYGKEELIAEMSAAFLAATCGISPPTIEQSAAYIENWRKSIQADKRLVVTAAGAAQKSADWILGARESLSEMPDDADVQPAAEEGASSKPLSTPARHAQPEPD